MAVNDGNTVSVDYWRTYLYFLVSRVLRWSYLKGSYHLCYSNTLKTQIVGALSPAVQTRRNKAQEK